MPKLGDLYVTKSKRLGLWSTLQVVDVSDTLLLVALGTLTREKPTAKQPPEARPFESAYYGFSVGPELARCSVRPEDLAAQGEFVCSAAPADISPERFPRRRPIDVGIAALVTKQERQHLWDALPQSSRDEFARNDFSASIRAADREAVQRARSNPLVWDLSLTAFDHEHVDIADTSIDELTLEHAPGVSRVSLSRFTTDLDLEGELPALDELRIEHPLGGAELSLGIEGFGTRPLPDLALPELESLNLRDVARLDLERVALYYPKLQTLRVWGAPGNIENVAALGRLSQLHELSLFDAFGFSADDFPEPDQLPRLAALRLGSIPKDVGTLLKQRFAHIAFVSISNLRGPDWVAQNAGNPFRHWDGRKNIRPADAKAAFKAYVDTQKRISKLLQGKPNRKELEKVMKGFVTSLNALGAKSSFETMERDDAVSAFHSLLEGAHIPAAVADGWWEQWEDF